MEKGTGLRRPSPATYVSATYAAGRHSGSAKTRFLRSAAHTCPGVSPGLACGRVAGMQPRALRASEIRSPLQPPRRAARPRPAHGPPRANHAGAVEVWTWTCDATLNIEHQLYIGNIGRHGRRVLLLYYILPEVQSLLRPVLPIFLFVGLRDRTNHAPAAPRSPIPFQVTSSGRAMSGDDVDGSGLV